MNAFGLPENDPAAARVREAATRRTLSHALLFTGSGGRAAMARYAAAALECRGEGGRPCGVCEGCRKVLAGIHPDVITVRDDQHKNISVDVVRQIRSDAYIRPNEGERKVYLLEGADQMNASAQNAMLKLLEEGPQYAAFLLLAENGGGLLQTVRSRCEELVLAPVPVQECQGWLERKYPQKTKEELRRAALDCQGLLGRAVEQLEGTGESLRVREDQAEKLAGALEQGTELELFEAAMVLDKQSREELPKLLDALERELTERMAGQSDRRRLFRAVELTRQIRTAARLNANPGQLAGWLCAGMFL